MTTANTGGQASRSTALIVAYGFPPYAGIGGQRTVRLLSYLAASDRWTASVLTARPESYTPDTPVDPELLHRLPPNATVIRTTVFRGLSKAGRVASRVKRLVRGTLTPAVAAGSPAAAAPPTPVRRPTFKRLLEELAAMPDKNAGWIVPATVAGVRRWSQQPPDVIYSSGPPWSGHLVAVLLSWLFNRPWVADFRDPWVRSPWTRYVTRTAHAAGAYLERLVVQRATSVIFTTQTARQEFAAEYGPELAAKFHAIPNGCDPADFAGLPALGEDADAPFVVLHAGSLYGGRSPIPLLRAAAIVRAESPELGRRLRLRFLGDSPDTTTMKVCEDLDLGGVVEFGGRVSRRQSLAEMRQAGALLILQAGLNLAIPGKLYEYFAAGRPVLALCERGEMADVIESNELGVVTSPDDDRAIADGIRRLMRAEPGWAPATPPLYDGRIRAAEIAVLLEAAVVPQAVPASSGPVNEVRG